MSMEEQGLPSSPSDVIKSQMYTLYFKGLVSQENTRELLAGFGVAIYDQDNNLLFQKKGPIHDCSDITVLEAELTALKQGLTGAAGLGISHVSIYCDHYQIFKFILGISAPEQDKVALLMADVQRIRQQFSSSKPILVTRNQIRFAYELAMETIVSEVSIPVDPLLRQAKATRNETCGICLDDEIKAEDMFSVASCGHQFCVECVKLHTQVKLFAGSVPNCPHYQCETKLTINTCANLLTPELRALWRRRIKEESVPLADRVYCPNPECSALMSKTGSVRRICVECSKPFCSNCKVPWHFDLSCDDYKRLGRNPNAYDMELKGLAILKSWRQCGKCQHMIELSEGCIHVICRCGYSFCYRCGAEWKIGGCPHRERFNAQLRRVGCICVVLLILVFMAAIIVPIIILVSKLK